MAVITGATATEDETMASVVVDSNAELEADLGDQDQDEQDEVHVVTPMPPITREQLHRMHDKIDKDKDGKVSVAEVVNFATYMHHVITGKEVSAMLVDLDKDDDGKLSWQEHLDDLQHFHQPPDDADEEAKKEAKKEMDTRIAFDKQKFQAADEDKDGFLSAEEAVFFFLPETHPNVLDVVVHDVMKNKDKDGDGYLSPEEMWEFSDELSEEEKDDFKKLDKDGNHLLDLEELREWESGLFHTEAAMLRLIQIADKDGDMEATAEELEGAREDLQDSLGHIHLNEWADHMELWWFLWSFQFEMALGTWWVMQVSCIHQKPSHRLHLKQSGREKKTADTYAICDMNRFLTNSSLPVGLLFGCSVNLGMVEHVDFFRAKKS